MITAESEVQKTPATTGVFHRILAAIDFSPASRQALCVAYRLACAHQSGLDVVHVCHPDWRYELLENPPEIGLEENDLHLRLNRIAQEAGIPDGLRPVLLPYAPVATRIVRFAGEIKADLIVLGTRGRGGLQKLALGSVAEQVLRTASCPVLTVGPEAAVPEQGHFRSIVFATDYGQGSAKALPLVLALAAQQQAKLALVHMIAPLPASSTSLSSYAPGTLASDELLEWEESSRKRSLRQMKEWLPPVTGLQQEPEFIVGTDFLPEGILAAIAKFSASLVVMGANRAGTARFAAHIPWTAVHEIVSHAPCPVLTVAA